MQQSVKKQRLWSRCQRNARDVWFPRIRKTETHNYVDFYRVQLERDAEDEGFGTNLCITLGDIVTLVRRKETFIVTLLWSWKMDSEFVSFLVCLLVGLDCFMLFFLGIG